MAQQSEIREPLSFYKNIVDICCITDGGERFMSPMSRNAERALILLGGVLLTAVFSGLINFLIEWSTASEWNSDQFNVEWSDDTENWRTISTTPAAGYSNQLFHYVYYDCFPQPIINYYRLVQFDFDGESETFGPIVVDNRKQEKRILRYVSLSGQEIDPTSTTGLVIGILEDGTTVKVYL